MNSGIGAMGPYNHANATIGRAYGLLSQNLQGGSVPGETYMGSLGNWYAYTAALRRGRGAQPLGSRSTSQQGFKPTDSTVSVFFGGWYTHVRLRPARHLAGEDPPLARRRCEPFTGAARRAGSDRGARLRRARLRHQAEADRLVRRERAAAGARVLGQPVDPDADAPAARCRRRAVRRAAEGRARRADPDVPPAGHQHRRRRRRDAARGR